MRSLILAGALLVVGAGSAAAQAPTMPGAEGRRIPGAEMLLARTGELNLTDAQVTRLAGIARRGAARRVALRATRDSIRARFTPGTRPDSATRRQLGERVRADMQRARDAERSDRRDAIAVLTADQQARAWEMVANRGGARGARGVRGGMRPGMRGRPGMQRRMMPRQPMGQRAPMRRPGE